jgi:hypothetical protein
MAKKDIYQIKVTLKHSRPPIWRRIQVPGDTRLDKLHGILQTVMGWWDAHLHQFIVGRDTYYGQPHPAYEESGADMLDETKVRLDQIATLEKFSFVYEYDFGDSWEHILLVEKILPPEPDVRYPRCLKGKRACPPEDVGGVWGYEAFLAALNDPEHPDHESMLDWFGDEFDPEAFDLKAINAGLANVR